MLLDCWLSNINELNAKVIRGMTLYELGINAVNTSDRSICFWRDTCLIIVCVYDCLQYFITWLFKATNTLKPWWFLWWFVYLGIWCIMPISSFMYQHDDFRLKCILIEQHSKIWGQYFFQCFWKSLTFIKTALFDQTYS